MAHKLQLDAQRRANRQPRVEVDDMRLRPRRPPRMRNPDRPQKRRRRAVNVNPPDAQHMALVARRLEPDDETPAQAKRRDREPQLGHDGRHEVVRPGEDALAREPVQRRRLQVADDEVAEAPPAHRLGDLAGRGDRQRRAEGEAEVCRGGVVSRALQRRGREGLAKVDDRVEQDAVARGAPAAGAVVADGLFVRGHGAEVCWLLAGKGPVGARTSGRTTAEIFLAAVTAVLEVAVAVQFGDSILCCP